MHESMNVQPMATLSYVWQLPGKPVSILLSLGVVDRLGVAVQEGCQSVERRGTEIGAFLLGRKRRRDGSAIVEIDDFELLESEHAVGPSFLLSAADRRVLAKRLRRRRSSKLSIVGFCRSHTRKDFAITIEDVDLMSEYFARPSMVCLVIQAISGEPLKGGFFIWEGRSIRMRPYLEFPFGSAELAAGNYELCRRDVYVPVAPREEPAAPPSSAVALPVKLPEAAQQLPAVQWPAWKAGGFRAAPLRGNGGTSMQRQLQAPLERLRRQAHKRFGLPWLLASAILASIITAGVLRLGPGGAAALLPQTLREADVGAVPREHPATPPPQAAPLPPVAPAPPATATVEDARLPDPLPERTTPTALPATPAAPPATPAASPATAAAPRPNPNPVLLPVGPAEHRAPAVSNLSVRVTAPGNLAVAPAPAIPPALPDAPRVADRLPGYTDLLPDTDLAGPEAPDLPDPLVSVSVVHIGKQSKHTQIIPPVLTHEAPLRIPRELRQRIRHEVPIDVKLHIDRAGKVEFAELLSDGTGSNRDLASLAVFSSRHCQFQPAHLGGEAVPGEVVLRFRFGPETR